MIQVFLIYRAVQSNCLRLLLLTTLISCENIAFADGKLPDLQINKLEDNIYLHTSFKEFDGFGVVASNGLVFTDDKSAFIIDTPTSSDDTKRLVDWFELRGFIIKGSISTHFHEDSSAGIEWLNSKAIATYASQLTNELLNNANKVPAKNTFDGPSLWLANDQIEVFYPGAGHTVDNVVVWMPKQRVLFGGCFVKSKSLGNLSDAVIAAWPDSVRKVIARYKKATVVVPGHGEVGDVSLLESTKRLALAAQGES